MKKRKVQNKKSPIIKPEKEQQGIMGMLTPVELAMIAATMIRTPQEDLKNEGQHLIKKAFRLWQLAGYEIANDYLKCGITLTPNDYFHIPPIEPGIFTPNDLPVTRDSFFKKVFPQYKNRADKLAQLGKAFVKYERGGKASTDEINELYAEWGTLDELHSANNMANSVMAWHKKHIRQQRISAGKNSAEKKREKKL